MKGKIVLISKPRRIWKVHQISTSQSQAFELVWLETKYKCTMIDVFFIASTTRETGRGDHYTPPRSYQNFD